MPTPDVVASSIMDSVAALMNDTQKQTYSYAAQLPYLRIALKELREIFELNNVPVTNETSTILSIPASTTSIGFATIPALPSDLVEIQQLWEREAGVDPFVPMTRKEFIPHYLEGEETSQFLIWEWSDNTIKLLPANRINDLKLDYIAQLFNAVIDQNSTIGVINCESFLHYRTAGLCSEFIGENKTRADDLNGDAGLALDRSLGITTKGRQAIATRHRPFRAGWKSRGLW